MNKRILMTVIALLLLSACVSAQSLSAHEIEVNLDKDGFGHVIESYYLKFDSAEELENFQKLVSENASSLIEWRIDLNWFYPRFGKEDEMRTYVSFDDKEKSLTLDYFTYTALATIEKDEARYTTWTLNEKELRGFNEKGLIVIPENTTVTIILPKTAEIDDAKLTRKASIINISGKNAVSFSGISTNYINLFYYIEKPIAPSVSLNELLWDYFQETNAIIISAAVLIVVLILYWKRKKIREQIENYIVEHSKITAFEPEEMEMEPDLEI